MTNTRTRGNRPVVAGVAALAMALTIGAAGGATAAKKIGSKDIKNNSVKSVDLKNGQVRTADLGGSAVTGAKVEDGSIGLDDVDAQLAAAAITVPQSVELDAAVNGIDTLSVGPGLELELTCSQEFPSLVFTGPGLVKGAGTVSFDSVGTTTLNPVPNEQVTMNLGQRNAVDVLLQDLATGTTLAVQLGVVTSPGSGCSGWGTVTQVG